MTNSSETNAAGKTPRSHADDASAKEAASGGNAREGVASEDAAGAEETPPETEADALRAELEAARAEQEETNNRLLRTAAELQNVRRRAAEEQRRRAARAKAAALRPMLEVLDDLQRALAAAEDSAAAEAGRSDAASSNGNAPEEEAGGAGGNAAFQSLRDGVEMVEGKFESALAGLGVEPIEAEGQPFDENEHEAMMQQPAPEGTAPGTVLAEIRRGYRMAAGGGDEDARVLRHSRVVVAAAREANEAPAEEGTAKEEAGKEEPAEE